MSSGCRPWLNVSCAPHSPCLVSILIPVCSRSQGGGWHWVTLGTEIPSVSDPLPGAREREREWREIIITEIRNLPVWHRAGLTVRRGSRDRFSYGIIICRHFCVAGLARLIRWDLTSPGPDSSVLALTRPGMRALPLLPSQDN